MDKLRNITLTKLKKLGKLIEMFNVSNRFTDGTVKCIFADGEEESLFPDGTIQTIDKNGVKTIETPDGRKRVIEG